MGSSAGTAPAREASSRYGIDLLAVQREGVQAQAQVRVTSPDGVDEVLLQLVRAGDGWAVVRTDATCLVVSCA